MSEVKSVQWSPDDAAAAWAVSTWCRNQVGKRSRVVLSNHDVFRVVFNGLYEAEHTLLMACHAVGEAPPNFSEGLVNVPSIVGGQEDWASVPPVRGRYGDTMRVAYLAQRRVARELVNSGMASIVAPEFGGSLRPVVVMTDDAPSASKLRIAPLALVVIGVLGVAAMAATAYVLKSNAEASSSVDVEKVRVNAELAFKQQVMQAQINAGKIPKLSEAQISNGSAESLNGMHVAGALGAALLLGVAAGWLGREQVKRP